MGGGAGVQERLWVKAWERMWCAVYLLYWYKSINTDANGAAAGALCVAVCFCAFVHQCAGDEMLLSLSLSL